MKTDSRKNRVTLAGEAVPAAECRTRVEDYLARTGLSVHDFARRIGYASVTMRFFMADKYHYVGATSLNIARAATEFMNQHPVGAPTRVTGELYETANVRLIQETFEKLLPRPAAYMIYAPPGSQKSFVLEHQVAKLNLAEVSNVEGRRAFYIYARQNLRPRDLIRRIATECGCRVSADVDPMLNGIRFEFRHNRVLLVIDEAQHLAIECFEMLRELLDRPPYFSLLFVGSHDLKRMFDEFSATLEQWNSRIIAKVKLPGLERAEACAIIERELGHLLKGRSTAANKPLIKGLIACSTTRDAFERNRTYINVRTLVNAIEQIKIGAADRDVLEAPEEVA